MVFGAAMQALSLARDVFPKLQTPMTCINVSVPLEVLVMDYTLLEPSTRGYENILVLTNMFTRFTIAVTTKYRIARTTDAAFIKHGVYVLWLSCSSACLIA